MKTIAFILSAALWAMIVATPAAGFNCANGGITQTGPCPPDDPHCCPPEGQNPIIPATSNAYREVPDLEVWGGVGEHQLTWTRTASSRYIDAPAWFGQGQNWRHSYQWDIADAGKNSSGKAQLDIYYPSGWIFRFTQVSATQWNPAPGVGERLFQNGTAFTLQRANGWRYQFQKLGDSTNGFYYQLVNFTDSQSNLYTLTYDANRRLVLITEPANRYLKITYQDMACNDVEFVTLAQMSGNPAAAVWTTLNVSDTKQYRYLRYMGPDNTYSTIAEMEFYDDAGNKLTGTPFGTTPAYGPNRDYWLASDGRTDTWFSYSQLNKGFTGIDLGAGNAKRISKVRFFPLAGYESRMNGGYFQGSLQPPALVSVISKVETSDGRSVTYDYQSYADPTVPGVSYLVLTAANYGNGTRALYTYGQGVTGTQPSLMSAIDPRYAGAAVNMKYQYLDSRGRGVISRELDGATNTEVVHIDYPDGNTNRITYPNGAKRLYYQPNAMGITQSFTDSLGNKTSYSYSDSGLGFVISQTDPLGRVNTYTHTIYGNLLSETLPDGTVTTWTRDSLDLPLTETIQGPGIAARAVTWTRDGLHRVTRIDHPDGSFESFTYSEFGQVLTHTLRNGGVETNTYDARALKTSYTDPLGNLTNYSYDGNDRLASVTDARGNTTNFTFNERGLVTGTTYADGTAVTVAYDDFGNKIASTNELGNTWTFQYDSFRRVIAETDPMNRTVTYSYAVGAGAGCAPCNATGQPTKITLPSGKATQIAYDMEWNKVSETVGAGTADAATTTHGYDAANNLTTVTDPLGNVTSYTYDVRDRRTSATDPLGNTTRWSYDAVGNKLAETRPDNGLTANAYDAMNRLVQTTDPAGNVSRFGYDSADNLISFTDGRNNSYGFTYDLLSRKTSMIYPGGSHEDTSFDSVGNVATYTTRAGQVCNYTYDSRNREIQASWNDGVTPAVTRTYDVAGRLLTLNNSTSALSYSYNAADQPTAETQQVSGHLAHSVGYSYDADGNRASLTYPSGSVISYSYTGRNQLASVIADGPPPLATYAYDLDGRRVTKSMENGTVSAYAYDNANRLLSVNHTKANAGFAHFTYAYNAVGNRTSRTESNTGFAPVTDSYGYDAIDQLTSVGYGGGRNVNYNYDPVGNRTSVTDSVGQTPAAYTANNLNQYTQVDAQAPTYDQNGNITSNSNATASTFSYDAKNRLTSATVGANTVTFAYDASNRCVSRSINGATTYFYFDGWNLIEERDNADALVRKYVQGAQVDEILAMISTTGSYFYHYDALGNVTALTDDGGTVVEQYSYDLYGTVSIKDGTANPLTASAFGNRFLFTGREWLAETVIYDYRNRVYSQSLGRFFQTDPIGFEAEDGNLYRYVSNKPTLYIDPFGLAKVCCRFIIMLRLGSHCELVFKHKGKEEHCGLNRDKGIPPNIGPDPNPGKRTCYDVGNIDSCLAKQCKKCKAAFGRNIDKDDNDGTPYSWRRNNSNDWVNRRLQTCRSSFRIDWHGTQPLTK
jgi:RHS repeat-associated protein